MIFGRKKNKNGTDEPETGEPTSTEAESTEAESTEAEATEAEATEAEATAEEATPEATPEAASGDEAGKDRWAILDLSQEWRDEGPFDFEEVDLEGDDIPRLDFGSLIITPMPECELRLQIAQGTDTVVSALLVSGESAMELAAYSAPRTPGMWAEIREDIIKQTKAAGGFAECTEGPFGTELIRNVVVKTPEGRTAVQASRTWMAEGPRWLLRGVLFGPAALTNSMDDEVTGPFFDAFRDVIVRRGENPMPVGQVLPLTIPEDLKQVPEGAQG